jgi:hypothetical protein
VYNTRYELVSKLFQLITTYLKKITNPRLNKKPVKTKSNIKIKVIKPKIKYFNFISAHERDLNGQPARLRGRFPPAVGLKAAESPVLALQRQTGPVGLGKTPASPLSLRTRAWSSTGWFLLYCY